MPTVTRATLNRSEGQVGAQDIGLSEITVTVNSMENVKRTAVELDSMLLQAHPRKEYVITVPVELLAQAAATQRTFNLILGSIAGMSLLVGGVGVMNVMLATVSQRTREIGIRRALGARRRHIIAQFLIETIVVSSTGALIGVLIGVAVPPLLARLWGMPVVIRPSSPLVAFLIAVTIGVAFGLYPAHRAAMLDPVEALRAD
jgi:putative ABC transport system permease protein